MQQSHTSYSCLANELISNEGEGRSVLANTLTVRIKVCRDAERVMLQLGNRRGDFTFGGLRNFKGWARASALAVLTALTLSTPLAAQHLIRCPDWKSLVEDERVYGLRKTPPKQSFDVALAKNAPSPTSVLQQSSGKPQSKTPKLGNSPLSASTRKTSVLPAACPTHTVKAGDTLGKIATKHLGKSSRHPELAAVNNIKVASALKIGQKLIIPCTQGLGSTAVVPEYPLNKSSLTVVAPVPKPAPLPTWRAKPGEYLTDVMRRWGKTAGYKVVKEGSDDWRLSVPVAVKGTFEEALQQIVTGFESTGRPPGVSIYSNKVVKVGAP